MNPANNHSWLSGVGTKSFLHPYNSNRGDEGFIPGSILPGHITFSPDYVESMDDFSFLWFENESIIDYQSQWIAAGLAASMIANEEAEPEQAPTKDFTGSYQMTVKKTSDTEGYLQTNGFNLFMYSTTYDRTFGDQKCAGIELIQAGKRIATNGDIHLLPTPEQWDATPAPTRNSRVIDDVNNLLSADLTIPAESGTENPAVDYTLTAVPEPGGVKVTVKLDEPLPADLAGKAGFNLEFIPSEFTGKSFQADSDGDGNYDDYGVFPLVPADDMEETERARTGDQLWYVKDWNEDRGDAQPVPFATGKKMTFASEDDENRIRITSDSGDLELYDGRNRSQNGWFVLRTLIPTGGTEIVWHISADVADDWARKPNVAHSQAGYEPALSKVAVIELDPAFDAPETAYLDRVNPDGTYTEVFSANLAAPYAWLRYEYRNFDFSSVTEPGMYAIRYADERTDVFPIVKGVYDDSWQSSLSGFLAVQMDHMKVREGYKIWHAPSHMDDAIQAPANTQWFDGWRMGSTIESGYEPGEHIPGLNVGGWYDAGDFDIQTSRNMGVIQDLALAFNEFGVDLDTLSVDFEASDVELHRPDGIADIKQQVKQGVLQILGQLDNIGFVIPVIEVPSLRQYTHLGDGSSDTDNRIYDSSLEEGDVDGLRSGKPDDRMALAGTKSQSMQYSAATALAASYKVLKGYDDALAEKCLTTAKVIWDEYPHTGTDRADWDAAIELLLATDGGEAYKTRVAALLPSMTATNRFGSNGWKSIRVMQYMDEAYAAQVQEAVEAYVPYLDNSVASNPFGVPNTNGMWGGSTGVVEMGVRMTMLHKYFPEIVSSEYTFRVMNYILGTHAYNSTSWLSGVGTKSVEIAYGSNRADNYYIAGGIVPGYVNIRPDFPEALDDYGFLWFESEYVIDTAAKWVVLANGATRFAADDVAYSASFDDTASGKISNNTTESVSGTAILAVYSEDGKLAANEKIEFTVDSFSDWNREFALDLGEYPLEEYTYKVYYWDTKFVPLCAPFMKEADMSSPRLRSITIDGQPLEDFDPSTFSYSRSYDEVRDVAPVVAATAAGRLDVTVTQAEGVPGEAVIVVSYGDYSATYRVNFGINLTPDSFVDGAGDDLWEVLNEDTGTYSINKGLGLRLPTQSGDIYQTNRAWNNLFARPAGGDWEAVAKVYYPVAPNATYQQIMLLAMQDEDNYIKLDCERGGSGLSVQFGSEVGGTFSGSSTGTTADDDGSLTLYFRISKTGNNYTGAFSKDGINYTSVGGTLSVPLGDVKLGLFATKNSNNATIDSYCEYVAVTKRNGETVKSYEDMLQDAFDNVAAYVFEDVPTVTSTNVVLSAVPRGYTVSGVSSNTSVLANDGTVQPGASGQTVNYTVTVSDGTRSASRTIVIQVGGIVA